MEQTTAQREAIKAWRPHDQFVHEDGVVHGGSADAIELCRTLELTEEDVLIASYPKSGTTWLQEIVYLMHNGADLEEAKQRPVGQRVMFAELAIPGRAPNVETLRKKPSPKLMFTHLRSKYFEKEVDQGRGKVVVVLRNPKDNLVSYFHFYRLLYKYPGTWDDFFELVKGKQLVFGDYFDWNVDWWRKRDLDNVYFVSFEDLKKDRLEGIRKLARFLRKDLSEEQLQRISGATSFQTMKNNPSTNQSDSPMFDKSKGTFMRKGQVGDWKNFFSEEQSNYIDEKVDKLFSPLGINVGL